jgi:hypothetical protein
MPGEPTIWVLPISKNSAEFASDSVITLSDKVWRQMVQAVQVR